MLDDNRSSPRALPPQRRDERYPDTSDNVILVILAIRRFNGRSGSQVYLRTIHTRRFHLPPFSTSHLQLQSLFCIRIKGSLSLHRLAACLLISKLLQFELPEFIFCFEKVVVSFLWLAELQIRL